MNIDKSRRSFLIACAATCTPCIAANALQPDEILDDVRLEERARDISTNLRCLVCRNQSIAESNADLARDLRIIVRERLSAGDTDEQIYDFVTKRYGDYVLLTPPFRSSTYLLWSAPVILFALGGALVWQYMRKMPNDGEMPNEDGDKYGDKYGDKS